MLDPISVLHVRIVSGAGGGPEKTILNSPRHLVGTRYRALAAYLHAPGDAGIAILAQRAREKACPFFALEDRYPIDLGTLRKLADMCRAENVKIWHGHDYKSNLYGLLLEKTLNLRLVTTAHGWVKHTARTPFYYAVDRWCLRRYEHVIAVARDLEQECLALGVERERLTKIDNAIDTEEFRRTHVARAAPMRAEVRSPALALPRTNSDTLSNAPAHATPPTAASSSTRLVVGAVGRLSPEKGFDLLIEAVERCVDDGVDLELWIAGEGSEKAALEARIARSQHRERLKLLGFQGDTVALFGAFDLFALSSLREGLPNVVLEAMAMEVPVLATRCGGLPAFGRHETDMLLCAPASVDELARGLTRLARESALRTRLASAARLRIERDLSFTQRMEKVVAVYDHLLRR